MWAQMITMRLNPGKEVDLPKMVAQLRAAEQPDSGLVHSTTTRDKKDPSRAPASLRRQMEDIAQSMAAQKRFIAEQDNENRRINARFDEELVRLKQLWLAQAPAKPAAASTRKTP